MHFTFEKREKCFHFRPRSPREVFIIREYFKFAYLVLVGFLEEAAVCVFHDDNDVDQEPSQRRDQYYPTGARPHFTAKHSRIVCH